MLPGATPNLVRDFEAEEACPRDAAGAIDDYEPYSTEPDESDSGSEAEEPGQVSPLRQLRDGGAAGSGGGTTSRGRGIAGRGSGRAGRGSGRAGSGSAGDTEPLGTDVGQATTSGRGRGRGRGRE